MKKVKQKSRIFELVDKLKTGEMSLDGLINQMETGALGVYEGNLEKLVVTPKDGEPFTPPTVHTDEASAVLNVVYDDIIDLFDQLIPGTAQERADLFANQRWETTLGERDDALAKTVNPEVARRIDELDESFGEREDVIRYYLGWRDILRDEVNRRKQAKEQKPKRNRQTQKLTPLDSEPYMFMASDKATKFFINSLMPNQTQPIKEAKLDALEARGISIPPRLMAVCVKDDDPKFAGLVSYNTDIGESVFRFFQEKSALAVKAHFALWARAHRETKAEPGKLVKMTISQFCDDLGFQKKKRAHTRENKQHALQILETLTSAEMILLWQDPQKKLHRTKGNVWQRGLSDEVFDTHIDDTNGQNENLIPGTEKFWDPKTFSYSPGGFFTDADWRKFNDYVGLVGQGLLKLGTNNKDKAAVLIGGYIAFLARIENYSREPLKLSTLIENTGDLLTGYIDRREAAMLETIVENALDRLTDVKVIKGYEWVYDEKQKPSDSDKTVKMPELLARRIRLFFPDELAQMGKEYKQLETVHRKNAAAKKAKAEQAKAKRK
jgi:hypothetical protein